MINSDNNKPQSKPAISDEDIQSTDLRRRSFLKGLGIFTGITALGLTASACKDDPVSNESDAVDDDANDDFDLD